MMSLDRFRTAIPALLASLILGQAFLAGRHLFGSWGIAAHGVIGNIAFMLGIALVAVNMAPPRNRTSLIASVAIALLLTAQIGLGYAGRTSLDAAAWHIPNGVLSFGLAVYLATRPARTGVAIDA